MQFVPIVDSSEVLESGRDPEESSFFHRFQPPPNLPLYKAGGFVLQSLITTAFFAECEGPDEFSSLHLKAEAVDLFGTRDYEQRWLIACDGQGHPSSPLLR